MSIDNFTYRAEAYAKGRPGYPKEAIDKIIELASSETVFADIGAGTGKLTAEAATLPEIGIEKSSAIIDLRGFLV